MNYELKGFNEIFYGDNIEFESLLENFNIENFKETEIGDKDNEEGDFEQINSIWNYTSYDFDTYFQETENNELEIY